MFSRTSSFSIAFLLLALMASACGGNSPSSPISPSPAGSGATITGIVNGSSNPKALAASATSTGMIVTVAGTSITGAIDGSGRFVLTGVPSGTVQLEFAGPGTAASLVLDDVESSEQIEISVTVSGTSVSLQSQHRTGAGKVEIEGLITAISDGATRSLQVAGTSVTVPAGATIRHGDTPVDFSALTVGDRVHVRGVPSGSAVVAEVVIVQPGTAVPPNPAQKVELEGRIAAINPDGMSRALLVDATIVSVPATAEIRHGDLPVDFGSLKVGDRVHVRGSMGATVLTADLVLVQNQNEQVPVNVKGAVSTTPVGSCPAISFLVDGWTIETDASTDFRKGSCASITLGTDVHAFGRTTATARLKADWIQMGKQ
jgi:hypothetical protein